MNSNTEQNGNAIPAVYSRDFVISLEWINFSERIRSDSLAELEFPFELVEFYSSYVYAVIASFIIPLSVERVCE